MLINDLLFDDSLVNNMGGQVSLADDLRAIDDQVLLDWGDIGALSAGVRGKSLLKRALEIVLVTVVVASTLSDTTSVHGSIKRSLTSETGVLAFVELIGEGVLDVLADTGVDLDVVLNDLSLLAWHFEGLEDKDC